MNSVTVSCVLSPYLLILCMQTHILTDISRGDILTAGDFWEFSSLK